jgi:hypothetical protein
MSEDYSAVDGPFNGYTRTLTPRGGILISYRDQDRHPFLSAMRVFSWIMASGAGGWYLFWRSQLPFLQQLLALALLTVIAALILLRRFPVEHSIEVHPDALIIDGHYRFSADDIGENWPQLQMIDDDENRIVLRGLCGTRLIDYATVNRLDTSDRTPERLAQDLEEAMEQLWGRRDGMGGGAASDEAIAFDAESDPLDIVMR